MKKVLLSGLGVIAVLAPSLAFAQTINTVNLDNSIVAVSNTVNVYIIPLFLTIAVLVFIYGVIKYVISGGAEEKAAARNYIIFGIIGIAVILAVWGLANILVNFFGVNTGALNASEMPLVNTAGVQG